MATIFKVSARRMRDGKPIKAEVFIGGTFKGWTPDKKGQFLVVEMQTTGKYDWYVKYQGKVIARGSDQGGIIEALYDG